MIRHWGEHTESAREYRGAGGEEDASAVPASDDAQSLPHAGEQAAGDGQHRRFFPTDHLVGDLKSRSIRGGVTTVGAQLLKLFLQVGSTAILARLLTPGDFGLIALVAAIIGFAGLFKDLGLSQATVQRERITHAQISTLFWINVAVSVVLALLVVAASPLVAWLYQRPELTAITMAMGGAFIFGGLSAQHAALLRRQMRFGPLALAEVLSMAAGIAAALVLAWQQAGYWALVAMQIVQPAALAAVCWVASGWIPSLPARDRGVRSMLAFGGNLTGFTTVNYFARNLDNVLIGWWWGAAPLGFYSKAYGLLLMPLRQINVPLDGVVLPALSRLAPTSEQAFSRYYARVLSLIMAVSTPLILLLMICSDEVILLLLGPQWMEAASLYRILAIAAIVQQVCNTSGWLYMATGRTRLLFRWGLFESALTVAAFVIGLPWGIRGVAIAYAVVKCVLAIPCMYFASRGTGVTLARIGRSVYPAVLASLLAAAVSYTVHALLLPSAGPFIRLILAAGAMAGVYGLLGFIFLDASARWEEFRTILMRRPSTRAARLETAG